MYVLRKCKFSSFIYDFLLLLSSREGMVIVEWAEESETKISVCSYAKLSSVGAAWVLAYLFLKASTLSQKTSWHPLHKGSKSESQQKILCLEKIFFSSTVCAGNNIFPSM